MNNSAVVDDLLTIPEAAELLRLRPSTLRSWTGQRRIPFIKVGRLVRIRRRDAEAYLVSRTVDVAVVEKS